MPGDAPDTDHPGDPIAAFARLFDIVRRLRAPDGCPWDREQSPETLRPSLIEEAWEAVSAIDAADDVNLREELGDIFLVATMMAWMREEAGAFTVAEALQGIGDKLVRRHPHVFGTSTASTSAEVLKQWEEIKTDEHAAAGGADPARSGGTPGGRRPSALERVPRSLPPLERSLLLQKKAAKVGFDWPGPEPVWEKIDEELRELKEALASGNGRLIESEAGDVLFSMINLARLLHVDPGIALNAASAKFERRFREMEKRLVDAGIAVSEAGLDRLDQVWNAVKAEESGGAGTSAGNQAPAAGDGGPQSASK
jgi:tetrapyrrole methylase family protein/MazG family protein